MANISTRGFVGGGDNVMIGGFIVQGGNGSTNVVLRGIGPSLALAGSLNDTMLEVHDANGGLIAQNDDWQQGADASFISANSLQPGDARESALLLRNPSEGAYTAVVRSKDNTAGVALVEVYVF